MFYTYVLLDPRKPGSYTYTTSPVSFLYQPFYVGKGKNNRKSVHSKYKTGYNRLKNNTIKAIRRKYLEPIELIIYEGLENDCFHLEETLISDIKRYPNGPLVNMTDGGEGNSNPPKEVLEKRGHKIAQSFNDNREERLVIISETLNTPEVLDKRAKTMGSEEIKELRRQHMLNQWQDDAYRDNISEKLRNAILNEDEETRKKRVKAATSESANKKRSESLKKTWAKRKAEMKVKILEDETMDNQQPSLFGGRFNDYPEREYT